MGADAQTIADIILQIPQQAPFRFIDEIIDLSEEHVVGSYLFKENEYFYKGHFPENPITPGVILTECMAQIGLVPLALYLNRLEAKEEMTTVFTDAQVEFHAMVLPNTIVTVESKKIFWRRNKLKAEVSLKLPDGKIAASGILSGLGVRVGVKQ